MIRDCLLLLPGLVLPGRPPSSFLAHGFSCYRRFKADACTCVLVPLNRANLPRYSSDCVYYPSGSEVTFSLAACLCPKWNLCHRAHPLIPDSVQLQVIFYQLTLASANDERVSVRLIPLRDYEPKCESSLIADCSRTSRVTVTKKPALSTISAASKRIKFVQPPLFGPGLST